MKGRVVTYGWQTLYVRIRGVEGGGGVGKYELTFWLASSSVPCFVLKKMAMILLICIIDVHFGTARNNV